MSVWNEIETEPERENREQKIKFVQWNGHMERTGEQNDNFFMWDQPEDGKQTVNT
jgi:hypothetical protein